MRSLKTYFLLITLLFMIISSMISCSKNDPVTSSKLTSEYIAYIKEAKSVEKLFTKTDRIELETTDSSLVSTVWGFEMIDSNIVVQESGAINSVKLFSNTGAFIKKIGHSGQGPGEYGQVSLLKTSSNKIVILDLALQRVTVFSKGGSYENSWQIKQYYNDMAITNDKIILLRSYSKIEDKVFDVFDYTGKLLFSDKLPESKNEEVRPFLAGGGFHIAVSLNLLYYIGNDDFKIICYNMNKRKIIWEKQDVPSNIKLPVLSELKNADFKRNGVPYTSIWSFQATASGLTVIETKELFLFYDDLGNYLNAVNKKYPGAGNVSCFNVNSLYTMVQSGSTKNDNISNPEIYIYEFNVKSSR